MEYLLIYLSIGFIISMLLVRYNPMKADDTELPAFLFISTIFWFVVVLVVVLVLFVIALGEFLVSLARIGRKP